MKAQLSTTYTNHCIRATCITVLDQKGIESRHIMSISGHKSENSIKCYSRNVSEDKKHEMCSVLQNVMNSACSNGPVDQQEPAASVSDPHFQEYELQQLDNAQLLSEIFADFPESGKENAVTPVSSCAISRSITCGPVFSHVNQVQIHYHMNNN